MECLEAKCCWLFIWFIDWSVSLLGPSREGGGLFKVCTHFSLPLAGLVYLIWFLAGMSICWLFPQGHFPCFWKISSSNQVNQFWSSPSRCSDPSLYITSCVTLTWMMKTWPLLYATYLPDFWHCLGHRYKLCNKSLAWVLCSLIMHSVDFLIMSAGRRPNSQGDVKESIHLPDCPRALLKVSFYNLHEVNPWLDGRNLVSGATRTETAISIP